MSRDKPKSDWLSAVGEPEGRMRLWAGGAIAVAALVAYWPSLSGGFVLDDDHLLTSNKLIRAPDGLERIWFTTEPIDYWPLTNTSFWIEWRLWRMNPTGYHVTNLLLHVASCLLLWAVLSRLEMPGACLAALLFAIHPVNVESVAWISQRKNTLSMFFFLLSVLWYLKSEVSRREPSGEAQGPARLAGPTGWYWLSLGAFTLAMLSKGSVAILPPLLLLVVWWQQGRVTQGDLVRTVPFFLVAIVLAAVNVWFQTHGEGSIRDATLLERLLGATTAVWFYLYKALVPLNLIFIYPKWNVEPGQLRWWVPLIAAVLATGLLIWQRRTAWGRAVLFAWLFFCIALVPVLGFTDVGFMQFSLVADRYLHIALIAVVTLAAAAWSLLYRAGETARTWATGAAAVVASVLLILSWRQSRLYADPITLYGRTITKNPDAWLAEYNLGMTLGEMGHVDQAIAHLVRALELNPDYADAHGNLAMALAQTGRPQEAVRHYQEALRLKPTTPEVHNNLGSTLRELGRNEEAIPHLEKAVELKPNYLLAHFNLAKAYAAVNRTIDATASARKALELAEETGQSRIAEQIRVWLQSYSNNPLNPRTVPRPKRSLIPP